MLPCLMLAAALSLGQAEAAPQTTTPAASGQFVVPPALSAEAQQQGASAEPLSIPVRFVAPPPALAPPPPAATAAADRWLLMKASQGTWEGALLDENRMQVYGWTDGSFTASSAQHNNLPMGFNYRSNEFTIQQNWLRIERTVVSSGTTEPTFGFRSDTILPGIDYRFTLAKGVFDSQLTARHGEPSIYGIDPIQFYGEAYFPTLGRGTDVKVGRFFALYGVETNDAVSNALCSHAHTFIYDPFTHTGVLATTKLTDAWTVQAGLVLGSDIFVDPADEPTFVGTAKWTRSGQRDSVLLSLIAGSGRFNQSKGFHNPEVLDVVYTHQFNPRLAYNFESLLGYTAHVPDIGTAHWFGVLNYLTYNFTPRLSGTTRLEFFDDEQGQRTGFKGLYTDVTAGLSFRPRKSIIFRPEVRYDYNGRSRPFEDQHGLFTAAADFILRW